MRENALKIYINALATANNKIKRVPGAGFEPATSGPRARPLKGSPDYESGALTRLGYPGFTQILF